MRRIGATGKVMLGVAVLLLVCVGTASAQISWPQPANALAYIGDPNDTWVWNSFYEPSNSSSGYTWDNITVPAGPGWNVTEIWGNFLVETPPPGGPVYWTIYSGMSAGNYGTLVASGCSSACTLDDLGSYLGFEAYNVDVTVPTVSLAPGTYWVGLEPEDTSDDYWGVWLLETSGANAFNAPDDGASYTNWSLGDPGSFGTPEDFSYGVGGQLAPTPEPISMIFFGTGLVAVGGYISRRRMLREV